MRHVLLDNEAIAALMDRRHSKHRAVVAHLEAVVVRRTKGAPTRVGVPTAVRVEAGWDRRDPVAAAVNRFRVDDHALDRHAADDAARLVAALGVSVADAHLGAVVQAVQPAEVVVLTSDVGDIERVSAPARVRALHV